ncbi:MAG TPA: hypothetical protein VNA14_00995 [Mycobacteriales bacterium]|nr:hypothetical protein [Mycobacteriales bacterium]
MASASRRRGLVALVVLGVAVAAAPGAFGMFSRAPKGGVMITEFAPYMSVEKIDGFRGHLDTIGAAEAEVRREGLQVATLATDWPRIDADMRSMLDTMLRNVDGYAGVAALPPFPLFPWFFVIPGVLLAALGVLALRRPDSARRVTAAALAVGIGVAAAPAAFQMFTRAPGGARMIDDFRPLMTAERVTTIQGYFLSLGAAEGELRNDVLPDRPGQLPATRRLVTEWPRISYEMAPMIGAMSDNLDNYAAVDALPPFWLFPWFFVIPGALVALSSIAARRTSFAVGGTPQRSPLAEGQPA